MQAYFEGRRDLFEGLAIERLESSWEKLPVLRFDFGEALEPGEPDGMGKRGDEVGGAGGPRDCLDSVLRQVESVYGRDPKAPTPGTRLYSLIGRAHDLAGKRVVVLVDDCDAPLLAVEGDLVRLREARIALGEFYDALKACDARVHLAFITGVTAFPQLGVSEAAGILGTINLRNISMSPEYAGVCGVTEDELLDGMAGDVDALVGKLGVSRGEVLERLRIRCGGYRFARVSPEVFNPSGLLGAFAGGEPGPSGQVLGVPAPLAAMMRARAWGLADLEEFEADAFEFDVSPIDGDALLPALYQLGYLAVKSFDPLCHSYTLGIPNEGVRSALSKVLSR